MTSNDVKHQLFMRRHDELAFGRLPKKQSSPITHVEPLNNEIIEFTPNDQVKRLDQQMADMKRKSRNGGVNGIGAQLQGNAHLLVNNALAKNLDSEPMLILEDGSRETVDSVRPPASDDYSAKTTGRLKHYQGGHISYENSVSNRSLAGGNKLSEKAVNQKGCLSNAKLHLPGTEVIDSRASSLSSISSADEENVNVPVLHPQKADFVGMFGTIPSTSGLVKDTSAKAPGSNQSQENKNKLKRKLHSGTVKSQAEFEKAITATTHNSHLFSSSPIKRDLSPRKKKKVAFSSDIENSPLTSSPIKGPSEPRSILKFTNSDIPCPVISIDDLLSRDLSQNESWPPGFVLQIPEGYAKTQKVVQSCVSGLCNKQFKKQYEVYATLNDLMKRSTRIIYNSQVFSKDIILKIILSVKNNLNRLIIELKNGSNAFQLRTSSQGIKLISMLSPVASSFREMSVIYDNVIKLLKNDNITKSLASSIFQLVKIMPDPFFDKTEAIILSLTQMKYFLSVTMTCEKLNILKRFIMLQPAIARKFNYQIFSHLLYSILNTDVPGYSRVLFSAISVFTTCAKNNESSHVITKILSEELKDSYSTIRSTTENQLNPWMTVCEAVCETMKYLIHLKLYSQTAKIWAYLLYMSCHGRKTFILEKWEFYMYFKSVYELLYSQPQAIALCLEAWKSVVYNFQTVPIKGWTDEQLEVKLESLLLPFENTKLIFNDGTTLTQWTKYEGYLVLYCRIYYSIRLQMEIATDSQMCKLLHSALKPLMQLKEWDSVYSYLTRMIFASDRYIYAETEDSCFWLSDYEKWKSRVLPLPKTIFKNSDAFSVIFEMARKLTNQPLEILSNFINNCIYLPLENMKLALPFREYNKVAEMGIDLVSEVFDKNALSFQKGNKDDASNLFKIVEMADDYFMFIPGNVSLMKLLLNKFTICENREFIVEFISLCRQKFNPAKLFAACLTSELFGNTSLLEDDDKFPQAVHYAVDITQLTQIDFSIPDKEKGKIVTNLKKAFNMFLSHNGSESYLIIIDFLKNSNLLDILNPSLTLELFEGLLDSYAAVAGNFERFYKEMPLVFFQTSLKVFDHHDDSDDASLQNADLMKSLLLRLKNIEMLPELWVLEVGSRLGCVLQPSIADDSAILPIILGLMHRLPPKLTTRLKKLAIKRQVNIITLAKCSTERNRQFLDGINTEEPVGNLQNQLAPQVKFDVDENVTMDDSIELETSVEETSNETDGAKSTQILSSPIKECNVSFVETDEEDYKKVFQEDNEAIKISKDLKSFIIDSIQIEGSVSDNCVRMPTGPEKRINESSASPARRTRSQTNSIEYEGVEFIMATKSQKTDKKSRKEKKKDKKEKREKRKRSRSRSRSQSVELDEVEVKDAEAEKPLHQDQLELLEKGINNNDVKADMGQFWKLLKKLNSTHIEIERTEKENLETDLVSLLMKLKKS